MVLPARRSLELKTATASPIGATVPRARDAVLRVDCRAPSRDQAEVEGLVWPRRRASFPFAGIWRPDEESSYMSFLTCEPNGVVGAVHPKAMPVMLDQTVFSRWLNDERVSACELAVPYPDEKVMVLK